MVAQVIYPYAGELDIYIEMGATFILPMTWTDESDTPIAGIEDWTARLQFRKNIKSDIVLLELTTENGGITLGDNPGEVRFFIDDATSSAFDWTRGIYQLELEDINGRVYRLLEGKIIIKPESTR